MNPTQYAPLHLKTPLKIKTKHIPKVEGFIDSFVENLDNKIYLNLI